MLVEKIRQDLVIALKSKQSLTVDVLRFLLAEILNFQTQKQKDLTDEEVITIIRRQIKQREEAIVLYEKGSRADLADKERKEQEILSKYVPQQITLSELEKIVQQVIEDLKVKGPQDFGRVMGQVMGKIKGQADGKLVAEAVKKSLT